MGPWIPDDHYPVIRPATTGDAGAIARIHVEAWRAAYAKLLPQDYLDRLSVDQRKAFWEESIRCFPGSALVTEDAGIITGWICFGRCRDPGLDTDGEVYAVYVDPQQWNRGIGKALMARAEEELSRLGYACIRLWVLKDNVRSIEFYRRLGYRMDGARKPVELGGLEVVECRCVKNGRVP